MKKRGNFISILIVLVFVVVPLTSLAVNHLIRKSMDGEMINLVGKISNDDIKVLKIEGRKASKGMLYVKNAWRTINVVDLKITPANMMIYGDTLHVRLDDNSDVYQGAIMLANLKEVYRNGKVTQLKEY